MDFATQYPGETLKEGLANWHKKAEGRCSCDYGFHMSITDWNPQASREIDDMAKAGVTSYKLYMTYDTQVDDKTIYQILKRLKKVKGIAGVQLRKQRDDRRPAGGSGEGRADGGVKPSPNPAFSGGGGGHPAAFAAGPGCQGPGDCGTLNLCGRPSGNPGRQDERPGGFAETCPQYLLMDDSLYGLPGFDGARYVIAPPLRKKLDQEILWKGLNEEAIQTVSTDHCSFTLGQKELGLSDFRKIPGGMPGVETRGILMYSEGVKKGRISCAQMCRLLSENPAKLYGMYPKKGVIAPGSDGDIVVMDPEAEDVITAGDQIQKCGLCAF